MKINQNQLMAIAVTLFLLVFSSQASAQLGTAGVLDQVVMKFASKAGTWVAVIRNAALWLFWTLGAISLTWTFGMMALRKADLSEFFAEFFKFIMFFGFFLWLLQNGPQIASTIITSLSQLAEKATGSSAVTPSSIIDIGFAVFNQALKKSSVWSPVDSIVGITLSAGVLIMLAIVSVNMMLLIISGWFLMFAGVFFLGFGGSKWTSEMAINYYKTVLGMAVQIFTMVLLLAIGKDLLTEYYGKMSKGSINFEELAVMVVFCIALLLLTNTVPSLMSGIITGASVGAVGAGSFGAGAAVGAAMTAAGIASGGAAMAAKTAMGTATGAAGGASALQAAFQAASGGGSDGGDVPGLGSIGGSSGGDEAGTASETPFAQAAGLDLGGGSDGSSGSDGGGGDAGSDGDAGSSGGSDAGSSGGGDASSNGFSRAAGIAVGTASALGQGIKGMAVESGKKKMAGFKESVSKTAGGKLASKIKGEKPSSDDKK